MSDFEEAVEFVLENEGGLVNDPADPGGLTNRGVSLRFIRDLYEIDPSNEFCGDFDKDGDVDAEDIRALTEEQAKGFYREHWWDKYHYGKINHQKLATKIFDLSVNLGPTRPHRILQQACCLVADNDCLLKIDGIIGEKTLAAINGLDNRRLLIALKTHAALLYRCLARKYVSHGKFLKGWLNRVEK